MADVRKFELNDQNLTMLNTFLEKMDEETWKIVSHMIITGARLNEAIDAVAEIGYSRSYIRRHVQMQLTKVSKKLGFKIVAHDIRKSYVLRFEALHVNPEILARQKNL